MILTPDDCLPLLRIPKSFEFRQPWLRCGGNHSWRRGRPRFQGSRQRPDPDIHASRVGRVHRRRQSGRIRPLKPVLRCDLSAADAAVTWRSWRLVRGFVTCPSRPQIAGQTTGLIAGQTTGLIGGQLPRPVLRRPR